MTAQSSMLSLPDGKTAPMWGFCSSTLGAGCSGQWTPGPTIVVPVAGSLEIDLKNNLPTPTSIVILGQLGGGLGTPVGVASPAHTGKTQTTWPANTQATFTPPIQGNRMQSFGTETAANGGTGTYTWTGMQAGTYLYETGTNPSIQAPMGLYGVVVVTNAPVTASGSLTPGQGRPNDFTNQGSLANVPYDMDAVMLLSEIDIAQNTAVAGLASSAPSTKSGMIDPLAYPPAVNYAPTYFLINGQAFDRTNASGIPLSTAYSSGNTMLRFANAGLRTHVPSVVGLNMQLIAEDGNALPGKPKVQNEVLLTAGKTYDVLVQPATTTDSNSKTIFASQTYPVFDRQLSLSAGNTQDSGIQTFLQIGNSGLPASIRAKANADVFNVPSNATSYSGNVLQNDIAIYNPTVVAAPPAASGTVAMALDGSFVFTPVAGVAYPVSFTYCGNGAQSSANLCTSVTLNAGAASGAPVANNDSYVSNIANFLKVSHPGVLGNDIDPSGYKLTAQLVGTPPGITLSPDGSFTATAGTSFQYQAVNSQGVKSNVATVNLTFQPGSGLSVSVIDAISKVGLTDYRWTIEEDTTYKNDAAVNTTNQVANTLALNFHKSYMPVVATGCVGTISCGTGQTASGSSLPLATSVDPSQVALDPNKHYYISVLPGDAANAFNAGNSSSSCDAKHPCGHTMGGATIDPGQKTVPVLVEPNPLQTAQLSVFIFEDNNPTNGDIDGVEEQQGLGGFEIILNDVGGRTGDPIGQITYDAFNMPLTNSLMGLPGCPYVDASGNSQTYTDPINGGSVKNPAFTQVVVGRVFTCPDGIDPSTNARYALAGQALIKNLMPGRFDVLANPGGSHSKEKWYQVSTLEGTRGQDAFAKVGEPAYFQEFGPPGFHTFIGFVNPDHVNAVNASLGGTNTVTGSIVNLHMARPINENLSAGSRAPLAQTTCYVSLNASAGSGANIAFAKCDQKGNYTLTGVPAGTYQLVAWDEWLDQIIAYKNVTVPAGTNATVAMGATPVFSWFTRVETNTFIDNDKSHKPGPKNDPIAQVPTTIRFRDGSISNVLHTDSSGNATFNELFPLFNWYVTESDQTRFTGTGVHVVVDGGGVPDAAGDFAGVLTSQYPVDTGAPMQGTERVDPATTRYEGLQGFVGQTEILDWAKRPYNVGENGGITGTVVYASTRPFDDPRFDIQNLWEPLVPRVAINLYQETTAPDGTSGLKLVNSTTTTSWDDFVSAVDATGTPLMQCKGQVSNDPFMKYTLGQNNLGKCYDGFHQWNQVQPAVYDGRYQFTTASDGTPLLPGKYVVEAVIPQGYTLVKEEDKNILIGDAFVAPQWQQFGALTNIFILPDQATVGQANQNSNNPGTDNVTTDLGHPDSNQNYPACVGATHRVPDYLSLFPQSGQVAPFAGADRPLCDRKEVVLEDQLQANASFFIYTEAHIASHFTGLILDDAASEINAASPDFGEKFAVPYVPISIKDFNGIEISRLHADQWGTFNGLTPSSWQVNVPNPAGYSPNMLITCMNDPGPIPDGKGGLMTDPAYNPMFANFCYTNPFMPGLTDYLDTPVLPVAAFASGYNPVDCAYPDATPAISRMDGVGFGPYLPTSGGTLKITALGTVTVRNPAYAGPSAMNAPYNQPTITRTYNFGTKGTGSKVMLGGVNVTGYATSWGPNQIVLQLPAGIKGGELTITASNGKSTVDGVNVTIEDRIPVRVAASANQSIQAAIDGANPGDLILVDAGTYNELVIIWKPVRLQGVGASSVIINAAKYPTNKLEAWRPRINTLFGIDAAGNQTLPAFVDPLPGQEITGGVVLLEPSVLSTEEGAGITVLAKNLGKTTKTCSQAVAGQTVYNFACYPSRIDGLSVTGGDAGGGIYVNGWAHNLEISNNRVYGNAGAFNGGVRIGIPYLEGLTGAAFAFDTNVHVHHNSITTNGTVEANAGSSGAGGGLSLCSGTDNYLVDYNFICGNYSMSDGGGIGHIGVSMDGKIKNNQILFNQSYNQGSTVHGGGIVVEGEAPAAAAGALTLGTGSVTIDSNLIQGNFSEAGSGGGIRLQGVNGSEVARGISWHVDVTNNMIVNNVAGWAGGGMSLADAVNTTIENNTIASNDSTGLAGPLFTQPTTSYANPAGVSTETTTGALAALVKLRLNLAPIEQSISSPDLNNNILWKNRSFFVDASTGTTNLCASNLYSDSTTHTCTTLQAQVNIGDCPTGAKYWDLGVAGVDMSSIPGPIALNPTNSILTSAGSYTGVNLTSGDPLLASMYCNGTRAYPGQVFEPGQPFLPAFNLAASITLDEAGNFTDLRYGPLTPTGDYRISLGSPAIDAGSTDASNHDFFGTPRPQGAGYDIGAHELLPTLTVSPTSLNFANVQVASTSAAQVITLTNAGTMAANITAINFGGVPAQYSQTNTCPGTLAAGATCTISVTLSPTLAQGLGLRATSLVVQFNRETLTVALTGNAVSPAATLTPTSMDFGKVQIGQTSVAQVATLTNTGIAPFLVGAINFGGAPAGFVQTNTCPVNANLAVGKSCLISITFASAGAAGVRTATLSAKAGANMLTVALSGTAMAQSSSLSPANLSFNPAQTGRAAPTQPVTLTNTGVGPLTVGGINFGGAANGFNQSNSCAGTVLAVGASCTINVGFGPVAVGAAGGASANLTVNAGGVPTIVGLTGSAVLPAASLTPTSLAFPGQAGGTMSAPMAVTLMNTGVGPLTLNTPTFTSVFSLAPGSIAGACGNTLAVGASCTINIIFAPAVTKIPASYKGTMKINWGAGVVTTNLSGNSK